ncbi:MAG: methyl-accepting chemotaxis protein [Deltaproteobacteria bacterium]|nr:methyl-accepting chemotaxis protein [Deltaproteobacteria bacterium]
MGESVKYKRKNIFIKKRFQTNFSLKFLALIVIESFMVSGLFSYLLRGTVITGYSGSELVIARTGEYFMPKMLLANLAVIVITASAGFLILLLVSHKIAGPLYRFEKSLEETGKGDLTHRFSLRSDDQMGVLSQRLNDFNATMDSTIARMQEDIAGLESTLIELKDSAGKGFGKAEPLMDEALCKARELKSSAGFFKTSRSKGR